MLAVWDDPPGERTALAEAIEQLRQALAQPAAPRPASGPRLPRSGTKHEAVLALLRRPEVVVGTWLAARAIA